MKIIDQNILKIKSGIICHQVNCKGVMGAGFAYKIRKKWPKAYNHYMRAYTSDCLNLGNVIFTKIKGDLVIAHCCGQFNYGRDKKYTNYEAIKECLIKVKGFSDENLLQVYIPYKMGCALGGGDWKHVEKIISEIVPNSVICKL